MNPKKITIGVLSVIAIFVLILFSTQPMEQYERSSEMKDNTCCYSTLCTDIDLVPENCACRENMYGCTIQSNGEKKE